MSFTSLIEEWPSVAAFARAMGVPYQRARRWRQRNYMPVWYWQRFLVVADRAGRPRTLDDLWTCAASSARMVNPQPPTVIHEPPAQPLAG